MGSIEYNIPKVEDFDICPHLGFVASDAFQLKQLGPYYKPWCDLLPQLSDLLASKQLRQQVRALPVLETAELKSDAERRYAYTALAFLAQAYVYEDPQQPEPIIPASISQPLIDICAYWGLQPVLSLIGSCLWNWTIKDGILLDGGSPTSNVLKARVFLLEALENIETVASFTGTLDEKVFNMVPMLVEAEGGCMVDMLLNALRAASIGDIPSVIAILRDCVQVLTDMAKHLQTLHEQCRPDFFYDQLRPYIAGSKGMETRGLPDGFVFELSNGERVSSKCVGATAAQSSLFQFLDRVFGVEHQSDFLRDMREYMPQKHRQFLDVVDDIPNLRSFMRAHPEHVQLQAIFNQCVTLLQVWRTRHIGIVTRFVVMPAKRRAGPEGVKGTGGSLPIPFLKTTRDETV